MFCKNCGQQMPDNVAFCPNCGEQNDVGMQKIEHAESNYESNIPVAKSKKPVGVIIAAIVVVIAVIVGVVIGIGALGKPKYTDDNAFATAAKNVDKDSEQYHMLNAFAAVQNVLFNSESFEFEFKIYGEKFDGKAVFGKDIISSEMIMDAEDEIFAALYNGMFEGTAYGDGIEVDMAGVLGGTTDFLNELISVAEEELADRQDYIEDMKDFGSDEEYINMQQKTVDALEIFIERVKGNVPAIDKAVQNIISNNHISYDALSEIYDNAVVPYIEAMASVRGVEGFVAPSFDFWWETIADFIANGLEDGDIEVSVSESGKGKKAVISYDIEINSVKMLESFYKYASVKEEVKAFLGEDADDVFDAIESELDYISDNVSDSSSDIKLSVETQNGYATKIKPRFVGESFTLIFANINKTTISEEEYNEIKVEIDDADDLYTFDSMDDIIDEMF